MSKFIPINIPSKPLDIKIEYSETSAHDKLLAMGFQITIQQSITTYQETQNFLNCIWVDKERKTVSTNFHHGLALSRILTQLLEEME